MNHEGAFAERSEGIEREGRRKKMVHLILGRE
jgi:hypothetical protein